MVMNRTILYGVALILLALLFPIEPVAAFPLPDDPKFSQQWGLDNTGQTGGTVDADIDAPDAWNITTGSDTIVVAVIDTGVDYTHPDLVANMWENPGDPVNGIDDDANGYVDDLRGWDFVNNDNSPLDDNGHGTNVAGILGARGNNTVGISGTAWDVSIMPLKFLNSAGSGDTSNAIKALQYANSKGADVIVLAWSGGAYDQAMKDAIDASPAVVVCLAGNSASDNDVSPVYPASYSSPNIIAVAASDHRDVLAAYSNYGVASVDLGAPGTSITTTEPGGTYEVISGTTPAAAHVAGVAALVKSANPTLTAAGIKEIILSTTDAQPAFAGKTVTGGRLNAYRAVFLASRPVARFSGTPTAGTVPLVVAFTDLSIGAPTKWNWSFGDGTLSTIRNPSHTYTTIGSYTVSLNATNAISASNFITKTGYILVSAEPQTTVPTPVPAAVPRDNGGSDNSDLVLQDIPKPVITAATPQTLSVNVGGTSVVTQVVVTGTGIADLIVTGTQAPGPGMDLTPPPGFVYQYLDITPARFSTITKAEITFTVPQSWLDEHHLTAQDIVLYHNVGSRWQALPTTVQKTENGMIYFTAASPGFSRFAIGVEANASSGPRQTPHTPVVQTFGDLAKVPGSDSRVAVSPAITSAIVVTQTTTLSPLPPVPDPGLPHMTAALIAVGGIGLIGGGLLVRRWWIRRQNPALFREYD